MTNRQSYVAREWLEEVRETRRARTLNPKAAEAHCFPVLAIGSAWACPHFSPAAAMYFPTPPRTTSVGTNRNEEIRSSRRSDVIVSASCRRLLSSSGATVQQVSAHHYCRSRATWRMPHRGPRGSTTPGPHLLGTHPVWELSRAHSLPPGRKRCHAMG